MVIEQSITVFHAFVFCFHRWDVEFFALVDGSENRETLVRHALEVDGAFDGNFDFAVFGVYQHLGAESLFFEDDCDVRHDECVLKR